jgi:DNA-binding NarL/FixJ family response regulator
LRRPGRRALLHCMRESPTFESAGGATTVLIVDDDAAFTRLATSLLSDRGYRVLGSAATAEEGLAEFTRLRPDALLIDVRLPDRNGVSLAAELSAESSRTSILLTSTDGSSVTAETVRRSGANGFVPKAHLTRTDLHKVLRP